MCAATYYSFIDSPLGELLVSSDGKFLTGLSMPNQKRVSHPNSSWKESDAPFAAVRRQLDEYFAGDRRQFDVPMKLNGTPFQQHVWEELVRIPYGTTITYGQLALRVGNPAASRAVGAANGRNPVAIIVPCHRVIGINGKLTGYASGIDNKEWLLGLERDARVNGPKGLFDDAVILSPRNRAAVRN
jgi:methylated-DNA-[protein]-cysteine S-methyltransferase